MLRSSLLPRGGGGALRCGAGALSAPPDLAARRVDLRERQRARDHDHRARDGDVGRVLRGGGGPFFHRRL